MVIIETKLHIPRLRNELVARPHLMTKLNTGLNCKLTLITAPPGYGKTTIVSEWTKGVNDPIAWVSLDQGDTNWVRFWTHSLAALKHAVSAFDAQSIQRFVSSDDAGVSLIAAMINGLNRLSGQIVMVWDDFHHVADLSILQGVAYLLQRLPTHVHLFLVSRVQPSLPLSKMLASGELNVLKVDDLRFGYEESLDFFGRLEGLGLSIKETTAVLERTEGWITGMRLVAISLNGKKERSVIFEEMIGGQREIADYFFEEVLSNYSVIMQQFLLQTSILDRMNGELCEAVTGIESSTAFIQEFEQNNLFIVPLDGGQEWYRYHHLFQQFLYMHLKKHNRGQLEDLHSKAGWWLEENGLVHEAMEHYLVSLNYEGALRLLDKVAPELMRYQWSTLRSWMDAIPDAILLRKPKLFMMHATSLFLNGETVKGNEKLAWAINQSEQIPGLLSEAAVGNFRAGLAVLKLLKAYFEKDFIASIEYSSEFVDRNPLGDMFVGQVMNQDGYHPMWDMYTVIGNLPLADEILKAYLEIWSKTKNNVFVAMLYFSYGKLMYEWNRLDEAEQCMQKVRGLATKCNNLNLTVLASSWLARIFMVSGRTDKAESEVQMGAKQVNPHHYPNLSRKNDYFWARHRVMQGETEKALEWVTTNDLRPVDEIPLSMVGEYDLLACLLAKNGRTEEAVTLIEQLLHIARREKRQGDIIRLLTHKSLILAKQGKTIQSMDALEEALDLAEPEGYIRTFLDEGEPLIVLLEHYLQARQSQHYRQTKNVSLPYVKQLIRLLQEKITYTKMGEVSIHSLTTKEMQVLQQMSMGISNKEIAQELDVSLSTVKTHINNIYRKLQVNNRLLAVQRATQKGLL